MKKVTAIYHKDCSDGTTAAAVILKKFPGAKVFPLHHTFTKEELDAVLSEIDNETEVYTVDCVIGVREILASGHKVSSLDHHSGVKEEYQRLAEEDKNFTFIFDNDKSGSSLAWSYFFPDQEIPWLVKYAEDVDLWKWKYGRDTKNVINYFSLFTNQPEEYLKYFNSDLSDIKLFGKSITMYKDEKEKQYSEIQPIKIKIGDYKVLAFNLVNSRSEMGHIFSEKYNQTVLLYNIDGDSVKLSLRAFTDYKPSAFELASLLGGGGHDKAAGGKIPLKKFIDMIIS